MSVESQLTKVRVRSWCRVDLAGGTLDIWPLGLLHPGACTVNVAVDVAVDVEMARSVDETYRVYQRERLVAEAATARDLRRQDEGALVGAMAEGLDLSPISVRLRSASPRGGGLGGSSAITVALLAASQRLFDRPAADAGPRTLALTARDIEARLMSLPTGVQDHYPSLYGGILEIRYTPGGESVRQLDVDLEGLGDCLVVAYTGQSHFSAGSNWQVVRRRLDGDSEATELFQAIASVAAQTAEALEAGDFARVGALVDEEWSYRRRLADGVSTAKIEALLAAAAEAGAWGGKACGAGGGGSIAVLCPPDRRAEVEATLEDHDAELIEARPVADRLRIGTD